MQQSLEIYPVIFNSIPHHVAILDTTGTIVLTNTAWNMFARENGATHENTDLGINYLDICDNAIDDGAFDAQLVASGFRSVIKGGTENFSYEYPCHSPIEKRWYMVECWPMKWDEKSYFIVSHQDVSKATLLREGLRVDSRTDSLTGLANRRYLEEFLGKEWRRDMRKGTPLSLIIMDVDFFKQFNDRYGHVAGDNCLKKLAATLSSFEQRPGDLAVRYGGEEFVLVLGDTSLEAATRIANNLCKMISELNIVHEGSEISSVVTASLGVATLVPEQGLAENILMPLADQALYKAKKNGRNTVALSNPHIT